MIQAPEEDDDDEAAARAVGVPTALVGGVGSLVITPTDGRAGELEARATPELVELLVHEHADGLYSILFRGGSPGAHALDVWLGGRHVPGSPFLLRVLPHGGGRSGGRLGRSAWLARALATLAQNIASARGARARAYCARACGDARDVARAYAALRARAPALRAERARTARARALGRALGHAHGLFALERAADARASARAALAHATTNALVAWRARARRGRVPPSAAAVQRFALARAWRRWPFATGGVARRRESSVRETVHAAAAVSTARAVRGRLSLWRAATAARPRLSLDYRRRGRTLRLWGALRAWADARRDRGRRLPPELPRFRARGESRARCGALARWAACVAARADEAAAAARADRSRRHRALDELGWRAAVARARRGAEAAVVAAGGAAAARARALRRATPALATRAVRARALRDWRRVAAARAGRAPSAASARRRDARARLRCWRSTLSARARTRSLERSALELSGSRSRARAYVAWRRAAVEAARELAGAQGGGARPLALCARGVRAWRVAAARRASARARRRAARAAWICARAGGALASWRESVARTRAAATGARRAARGALRAWEVKVGARRAFRARAAGLCAFARIGGACRRWARAAAPRAARDGGAAWLLRRRALARGARAIGAAARRSELHALIAVRWTLILWPRVCLRGWIRGVAAAHARAARRALVDLGRVRVARGRRLAGWRLLLVWRAARLRVPPALFVAAGVRVAVARAETTAAAWRALAACARRRARAAARRCVWQRARGRTRRAETRRAWRALERGAAAGRGCLALALWDLAAGARRGLRALAGAAAGTRSGHYLAARVAALARAAALAALATHARIARRHAFARGTVGTLGLWLANRRRARQSRALGGARGGARPPPRSAVDTRATAALSRAFGALDLAATPWRRASRSGRGAGAAAAGAPGDDAGNSDADDADTGGRTRGRRRYARAQLCAVSIAALARTLERELVGALGSWRDAAARRFEPRRRRGAAAALSAWRARTHAAARARELRARGASVWRRGALRRAADGARASALGSARVAIVRARAYALRALVAPKAAGSATAAKRGAVSAWRAAAVRRSSARIGALAVRAVRERRVAPRAALRRWRRSARERRGTPCSPREADVSAVAASACSLSASRALQPQLSAAPAMSLSGVATSAVSTAAGRPAIIRLRRSGFGD